MLDKLKWYLVEIGVKKYAPMGIGAAFAAIGTYLAAHAEILEPWGITYTANYPFVWATGQVPTGPCILVELDTLSALAYVGTVALVAVIVRAGQHHVSGTPVVVGGQRASDPPAAIPPEGETK
jgi:hypothetical protein